jgi:putative endonuclease
VQPSKRNGEIYYFSSMKPYFIYIITNANKTALYIGVTNDLNRRLYEYSKNRGNKASFATKYFCYHLLYFETFPNPSEAIAREKQLKKWSRQKKLNLIASINPDFNFLEF